MRIWTQKGRDAVSQWILQNHKMGLYLFNDDKFLDDLLDYKTSLSYVIIAQVNGNADLNYRLFVEDDFTEDEAISELRKSWQIDEATGLPYEQEVVLFKDLQNQLNEFDDKIQPELLKRKISDW